MSSEMLECGISTKKLLDMHKCINELRKQNIYCDVTVKAGKEAIQAHGGVLCAHSPYFCENLKDLKGEKVIEIMDIEAEIVRRCIEFMYTGEIEVNLDNVEGIAKAIQLFGIKDISPICEKALEKELETYNVMDIRRIALQNGWADLTDITEDYMRANGVKILTGHSFVLYTKEEFMWFLRVKDTENPIEEMQVWNSIIRWTEYGLPEREADLFEVLQIVVLDNLSVAFMNDSIRREQVIMRSQECMKYLLSHLFSRLTAQSNDPENNWPKIGWH